MNEGPLFRFGPPIADSPETTTCGHLSTVRSNDRFQEVQKRCSMTDIGRKAAVDTNGIEWAIPVKASKLRWSFPLRPEKFPFPRHGNSVPKLTQIRGSAWLNRCKIDEIGKIPVIFPLKREIEPETSSQLTASSTSQSADLPKFLPSRVNARLSAPFAKYCGPRRAVTGAQKGRADVERRMKAMADSALTRNVARPRWPSGRTSLPDTFRIRGRAASTGDKFLSD
jgi:hypothetical protein